MRIRLKTFFVKFLITVGMVMFVGASVASVLYVFSHTLEARGAAAAPEKPVPYSRTPVSSVVPQELPRDSGVNSALPKAEEEWELLLVNSNKKLPEDFENVLVTEAGMQVDSRISQPLHDMLAAAAADGVKLLVSSGYRSEERQEELYKKAVNDNISRGMEESDAQAVAADSINPPGYSEHSTGLAIDLNGVKDDFGTTEEFTWLAQHAKKFGFVLRYPKEKEDVTGIRYEPWHFRFVGAKNAEKMNELDLCLEEYRLYRGLE